MEVRTPQVSIAVVAASLAALVCPAFSRASSRDVGFAGGSRAQQTQVRQALGASSFDWNMLPGTVVVHISPLDAGGYATPGNVFLDSRLLDMGEFSWGVVQHEFGHEVDFLMLHDDDRSVLQDALGATAWCSQSDGLPHAALGCERFASELAWTYWSSPQNSMRPEDVGGESAGMAPAAFRALLARLLHTPGLPAARPLIGSVPPNIRTRATQSPRASAHRGVF